MFRGIYLGTSAMLVQEKMLDVVGNNLANVDTSGFRTRVAVNQSFPEVLMNRIERYTIVDEVINEELGEKKFSPYSRMAVPIGTMSMANIMSETVMSKEQGVVQLTDNPTDVMINGQGFFVVEDGAGNTFYTRSGHFQRNPEGQLVTHNGEFVVGDGGRIEIGEGEKVSINERGQIYVDGALISQLRIVDFENPTYLKNVGRSLLSDTGNAGEMTEVETPRLEGGALERSNVQVVLEMVRMIEANRAYEASGRAVTIQDELSGRLYTSVGKP